DSAASFATPANQDSKFEVKSDIDNRCEDPFNVTNPPGKSTIEAPNAVCTKTVGTSKAGAPLISRFMDSSCPSKTRDVSTDIMDHANIYCCKAYLCNDGMTLRSDVGSSLACVLPSYILYMTISAII
ncbi:unnamed protein product, partial [Didymodactylos carnosus]